MAEEERQEAERAPKVLPPDSTDGPTDVDRLRDRTAQDLRRHFDAKLSGMVDRKLALQKIGIMGQHHFSRAFAEARDSYIDGHFIPAIMTTQAVCEGLAKFASEKANAPERYWSDDRPQASVRERIEWLRDEAKFERGCVDAFTAVHSRERNAFHHMNRSVPQDYDVLERLARECMDDLFTLESWFFAVDFDEGKIIPLRKEYWPIQGQQVICFVNLT